MTDQEFLDKIRKLWSQDDHINRDLDLARLAIGMHPTYLQIRPAKAFPYSNWKVAQRYLLDTSAGTTMRLAGFVNLLATLGVIWLFFFSALPWYVAAGVAIGVAALSIKWSTATRQAAILKGVTESTFVFTMLWKLKAYALEVDGSVYEPTGNTNAWQDVVFLALGLNDLIASKPLTRLEQIDKVLGPRSK